MNVKLKDFQPINSWTVDNNGPTYQAGPAGEKIPLHIIDETTGRRYWNESRGTVRFKAYLLSVGTPFVHSIAAIVTVAFRILKLVTLSHLWADKAGEEKCNFKARVKDAAVDLLKVAIHPIVFVGLELVAIYGMFRPYDGRKLYASLERAQYEHFVLAPCFQPDPRRHLFGGDINKRDVY